MLRETRDPIIEARSGRAADARRGPVSGVAHTEPSSTKYTVNPAALSLFGGRPWDDEATVRGPDRGSV